MIYITGDTHIPINLEKLTDGHFPEQEQFTKSDYIIITGDFSGIRITVMRKSFGLDG